MPNLDDPNLIDESTGAYDELLKDLQCNILSGNGRPNTHYFFLRFSADAKVNVKGLLRALARAEDLPKELALEPESSSRDRRAAYLKTAKHGHDEPSPRLVASEDRPHPHISTNLLLTSTCYSEFLEGFPSPPDPAFVAGMATRDDTLEGASKLNDPPILGKAPPVHAVYVVGYDLGPEDWEKLKRQILNLIAQDGVTVHEESGYLLRHETKDLASKNHSAKQHRSEGYAIEPFGYRDAISQPLFFKADLEAARRKYAGAAATVGTGWDSSAPLSLVLVPDPHGDSAQPCGSYVAYRKIKQKVDCFYQQAERLAQQLASQGKGLSRDEVADRLIGRRVDGTTLDQAPQESPANDFTYDGSVCPMHAHARKVNPRTKYGRPRRIVRRATVFGPKLERKDNGRPIIPTRHLHAKASKEVKASEDVGLLFFCCQADIAHQFEEIQSQWANDLTRGADAVIGQFAEGTRNSFGLNGSGVVLDCDPVVEVMAGEYFFAPSIRFFSRLK